MTALLLTLAILQADGHFATTPLDAWSFASACTRHATPLVPARLLCAVAWVESTLHPAPTSNPNHCGAWQMNPDISALWHDDCWVGDRCVCDWRDTVNVDCEEVVWNVDRAAEIAARHLHYVIERRSVRRGLCRYHGQLWESPGCDQYLTRVDRALRIMEGRNGD